MISFLNVFKEDINNDIINKPKFCKFLKTAYFEEFPNGKITKSTRAKNELIRAAFGKNEENLKSFISKAVEKYNQSFSLKISLEIGSYEVFGEFAGASSKYDSLEIFLNGLKYFITNTDKNNESVLNDKRLAPKNIGIKLGYVYDDFEKLASDIDLSKIDEPVKKYIEELIEVVRVFKNPEKYGCFSISKFKVTDCLNYDSGKNLNGRLILKTNNLEKISLEDRQIVSKDFGEVLGPLIFLRMFKGAEVKFPNTAVVFSSSINENLVDYYVNGIKISSKSMKASSPSGMSSFKEAFSEIAEKPNLFSDEEKAFIFKIKSIYDEKSMFLHQKSIIQNYLFSNCPEIKAFLDDKISFSSLSSKEDLAEKLDFMALSKYEFFKTLYQMIREKARYFYKYSDNFSPENIEKNYPFFSSSKLKWGIIFYPLYAVAVKKLSISNDKLLSSVMQKIMDIKQCYLYVKSDRIEFSMYSTDKSNWRFITGGPSTNQITNSHLKISMVK